jgi:hypothetical protein
MRLLLSLLCFSLLCVPTGKLRADLNFATMAFNDAAHSGLVEFSRVGSNLQVRVTYSQFNGNFTNASILGAVFFNLANNPGPLTAISAVSGNAGGISNILFNHAGYTPTNPYQFNGAGQLNLAGETAFKANVHGFNYGLSSVGYGDFGPPNLIGPSSLIYSHSNPPNGPDFGILAANYVNGNGGLSANPEVKSVAIYTLSGLGANVDLGQSITAGRVQFGTSYSEPHIDLVQIVPVPTGAVLFVLGGGCVWALRRRKKAAEAVG